MRPERCGCGGELEQSWYPDGRVETGWHCIECGFHWHPEWGLTCDVAYQRWQTYLAALADALQEEAW
jgi:hypothetical protein